LGRILRETKAKTKPKYMSRASSKDIGAITVWSAFADLINRLLLMSLLLEKEVRIGKINLSVTS